METVGRFMLRAQRQFIIVEKAIFMAAIIRYAKALPDPVDDDGVGLTDDVLANPKVVTQANSYVYLRIFRRFLKYCGFRQPMMLAGAKIVIDELEHDPPYADASSFLIEELVEAVLNGEYQPRHQNNPPPSLWKEPMPYGNFIGRKFKELIKA